MWEITGPMQGFDTVDVQQGTLGLSGNNDGFTGKITVRKDASLSAKAESLPVNHPVNDAVQHACSSHVMSVGVNDRRFVSFCRGKIDSFIDSQIGFCGQAAVIDGQIAVVPKASCEEIASPPPSMVVTPL